MADNIGVAPTHPNQNHARPNAPGGTSFLKKNKVLVIGGGGLALILYMSHRGSAASSPGGSPAQQLTPGAYVDPNMSGGGSGGGSGSSTGTFDPGSSGSGSGDGGSSGSGGGSTDPGSSSQATDNGNSVGANDFGAGLTAGVGTFISGLTTGEGLEPRATPSAVGGPRPIPFTPQPLPIKSAPKPPPKGKAGAPAPVHKSTPPKSTPLPKTPPKGKPAPANKSGQHPATAKKTPAGTKKKSPAEVESVRGIGSGQVIMGREFPGAIGHRLGAPRRNGDGTMTRTVTLDYGGRTEVHLVHNNGERWTDRAPGMNPPSRGVAVHTNPIPV